MFAHLVAKILKIDLFYSNHNGFNIFIQRNDSSPRSLLEAQLSLLIALKGLSNESSLADTVRPYRKIICNFIKCIYIISLYGLQELRWNTNQEELHTIATYYFDGQGKALRPMVAILMARAINHHMHKRYILHSLLAEHCNIV